MWQSVVGRAIRIDHDPNSASLGREPTRLLGVGNWLPGLEGAKLPSSAVSGPALSAQAALYQANLPASVKIYPEVFRYGNGSLGGNAAKSMSYGTLQLA